MDHDTVRDAARALYSSALVWDAHSGFMPDPLADLDNLQIWRKAGVSYLSIDVGFDVVPWQHTVRTLAAFRHWILSHPDDFVLVDNVHQIQQAKRDGKLAVTFDVEGANALDGRIEMVEFYHRLGVRQMLFAYNRNNLAGGGCHDEDTGLTDFGRQVIDEMNRLGMFVDVTHCGYRTSMDVMAYSNRPVIFSHSNPKALCGHGRNITDAQILACAATGGLIGFVGLGPFMGEGGANAARAADHIDYLLDKVAPLHVGIGLDYAFRVDAPSAENIIANNPQYWPASEYDFDGEIGYMPPSQLLELTEILLRRGHREDDIRGVLGGNFIRLAAEVWR